MPRVPTKSLLKQIGERLYKDTSVKREVQWLWESCHSRRSRVQQSKLVTRVYPNVISQFIRLYKWKCKGVPLQYLIGWQPFGPLKILCRPHVLIPRWETEEWLFELAKCILSQPHLSNLKLVDFCTGSGCIPLLLMKMAINKNTFRSIDAIDVSPYALNLTKRNLRHNNLQNSSIFQVSYGDILESNTVSQILSKGEKIDILTCNPPYVSKESFRNDVDDSVKNYEPHLALIGDLEFYQNLILLWLPHINSFVYELGSYKQYLYVKEELSKWNQKSSNEKWSLGIKFDSNGKLRCVYGYTTKMKPIFQDYGQQIIIQ
ncbi:hypothetical protein RI543_004740 [Arxiozyma heterogenica]|uniref:peptide chain release factor N(5)-glutamine methyltransferase n=1 Tax=Arxiozyma heterogenica TaxID=278026 RepID=A0AAN7WRT4_9SACH|nr:hypothetical protein RI543_004740 [Kazachstania heterogenica]